MCVRVHLCCLTVVYGRYEGSTVMCVTLTNVSCVTDKCVVSQAKNFLRAFRTLTEAAALGLLLTETDEFKGQANLLTLIPSLHRFLMQQINSVSVHNCFMQTLSLLVL